MIILDLVWLVLLIVALITVWTCDIKTSTKIVWTIAIVIFPLLGSIAWFVYNFGIREK